MVTVTICDEVVPSGKTNEITLDFLDERITVRELIRSRVYQEVREYNAKRPEYFRGLVQPKDSERMLNGFRLKARRKIDWEEQFKRALAAFESNGFMILVDHHQAEDLDEEIDLRHDTEITFLKLVPLAGG